MNLNLILDQDNFSNNVTQLKAHLAQSLNSPDCLQIHNNVYAKIQELLQVPYTDDKYIFELFHLQAQCQIDDGRYTKYDPIRCAQISQRLIENRMSQPGPNSITITMTTCKRYDLFVQTMNSFLVCIEDLGEYVYDWIVIDDNSSPEDRQLMQANYPFIRYIFKTPEQKGHARSMNILLDQITTPYIFHLEDDWRFFTPGKFLGKCLTVLQENPRYGQCLLNRGYSEDLMTAPSLNGGYRRYTKASNLRYYIHEYLVGVALDKLSAVLRNSGYTHCSYWPHYSLRVGLTKKEVFDKLGKYNESANHFERDYAYRYREHYLTTYLDNIYCTHIGRRTYERDSDKLNAYDLNREQQFGQQPKALTASTSINNAAETHQGGQISGGEFEELKLDAISAQTRSLAVPTSAPVLPPMLPPQPRNLALKTYVLNLERRPDRLTKFKSQNTAELPHFHHFLAIDGKKLKPDHTLQKLFEHNDYNYRRGIVGCALSHLLMWIELLSSPELQGMLIIEDDAELTKQFIPKFVRLLEDHPTADILFLGHHPYPAFLRNQDYDRDSFPSAEQWSKARSQKQSMGGTTAYYISKQGASNMIEYLNKNGFRYGVDWEMFHNEKNKVFYCSPFLAFADCAQTTGADTDIQTIYDGVGYSKEEWWKEELKYWDVKGIKNKPLDIPCVDDPDSKIVFWPSKCSQKDLLTTITVFKRSSEMEHWLDEYPVHWYTVKEYIISIPDNRLSDKDLKNRVFYGHINLSTIRTLRDLL